MTDFILRDKKRKGNKLWECILIMFVQLDWEENKMSSRAIRKRRHRNDFQAYLAYRKDRKAFLKNPAMVPTVQAAEEDHVHSEDCQHPEL